MTRTSLHQCQNMLCLTLYNTCAGGSAGVFIWPLWCPCGCLTCCCPLKICDVLCCTCKAPEARCDSLRYIGQRVLYSGAYDVQKVFPFPTEDEDNTTTEADTYKGHEGPWTGAYPNKFVSWFESLGDLMTSLTFLAPLCIQLNTCRVAPNTTWQPASGVVGQKDSQVLRMYICLAVAARVDWWGLGDGVGEAAALGVASPHALTYSPPTHPPTQLR